MPASAVRKSCSWLPLCARSTLRHAHRVSNFASAQHITYCFCAVIIAIMVVHCAHRPPTLQSETATAISQGERNVVLGGDLNCVPSSLEVEMLRSLLPELTDAWHQCHPGELGATANSPDNTFASALPPPSPPPSLLLICMTFLSRYALFGTSQFSTPPCGNRTALDHTM